MNLLFRMLREAARASSGFITLLYERFVVLPHNVKQALLLLVDLVSIPVALFIATTLRYGTLQVEIGSSELLVCAATVLVSAVVFLRLGLYRAIVRFMGHEAIVAIVKGVTISALLLALFLLLTRTEVPRSLPMIYWCLMLICVGGSRLLLRSWYRHRRQRSARRIAIYGAGSAVVIVFRSSGCRRKECLQIRLRERWPRRARCSSTREHGGSRCRSVAIRPGLP